MQLGRFMFQRTQLNHRRNWAKRWASIWAFVLLCAVGGLWPNHGHAAPGRAHRPSKDAASVLIQRLQSTPAGKERDELVDQILDHGDAAWPDVRSKLDALAAVKDGEDVVVDLLLGFGLASYEELANRIGKMGDSAARRIARQLLGGHYPKDDRQLQILSGLCAREDDELLLMVLPEVFSRNPTVALARVVRLVDDRRANLRAYAIDTLVAQNYTPGLQPMVRLLGIEQVKATPDNLTLRIKLISAIARLGKGNDAAADPLIAAVDVADQREAALDGLALVGAPAVRAAIFLMRTADRGRIETALAVLNHLRVQAAPELLPLIAGGDERTRALAMDMLAHLGVTSVRAEIVNMVRLKRFSDLRVGLQLALSMYDPSVRQLLLDLLTDKDPTVRTLVVDELWNLQDPETYLQLRTVAARDTDRPVRMQAALAIAGMGDAKALEFLRKMVDIQDTAERVAVIEALGRVDGLDAVPALARLLSDPADVVFRSALLALRKITFHSGPRRESEWLGWLAAEKRREPEKFEEVPSRIRKYAVDGIERAYQQVDEDDDRTIVVLSGPPYRDSTHLAPQVYRLANDFQLIVPKRAPGDGSAATTTLAERTADLDQLLNKVAVGQVVLLADPAGAHFALTYAAMRTKRISHVILHGGPWPSAQAVARMPGEVFDAMQAPWRDDVVWALRQHALLTSALQVRTISKGLWTALLQDQEQGRRLSADNLYPDGFTLEARERALHEVSLYEPKTLAVPTLLLLGDKAPWSASVAAEIAALGEGTKKQLRVVKVPDCKAFPLLDNPGVTLSAIHDFLK